MILENRDPNGVIKSKPGTRFNQVISEPKNLQTEELFWYPSSICYDRWRLFVYQCLSFFTAPCISGYFAGMIGSMMFVLVWFIQPCFRLQETCVGIIVTIFRPVFRGRFSFLKRSAKDVLKGAKRLSTRNSGGVSTKEVNSVASRSESV